MSELFAVEAFRNAFIMSLILSILFGLLSFFVVMRKMVFLGAGVSHSAFGGVAIALFFGLSPFPVALIFCVAVSVIIGKMVRSGKLNHDNGIGIFFSFSMAFGALLISIKKDYNFDFSGYLFGDILGIQNVDLYVGFVTLAVFVPFVFFFLHRILFMTFDEESAKASGVPTGIFDTFFHVFLAVIIVVSMKFVGIILVSALVVLPASFAMLISKNFRIIFIIGILYSLVLLFAGLIFSRFFDFPAGGTIVTLGTLIYFITFYFTDRFK